MAHQDIEWAYGVALPAPQKAVLLALAHCKNGKTGRCFPSQQEISTMTGLGLSTVKRSLDALATERVISRTKTAKGRYRSNDEYRLNHSYESTEAQPRATSAHSEPRPESPKAEPTQSKSTAQSGRAVEPTGIEPEDNRKGAAQKRGTRIPDDFTVTPTMIEWARENAPDVERTRATTMFINYWTAATGRNATKRDWEATWRNWLLKDQQFAERAPGRKQTPTDRARQTAAAGQRVAGRLGNVTTLNPKAITS
ncbi:MAG: helix-turn-helix domain-containing protein [Homoserinimonas sp.]